MSLFLNQLLRFQCLTKPSLLIWFRSAYLKIPNGSESHYAIENDILYSSVLEASKSVKFTKRKVMVDILSRQEKLKKFNDASSKSFPLSLSLMNSSFQGKNEGPKDEHNIVHRAYESENLHSTQITNSWMRDYEFFDELESDGLAAEDPSLPPSKVPCGGCGSMLHCMDISLPGFLPKQIFEGRTNEVLKTIVCQRCHFLKTYNIALDVTVSPEEYTTMLTSIKDKFALVVLLVDLIDMYSTIWPGIQDILGKKRPIVLVGNKVDLLPKDSRGYLEHAENCLIQCAISLGINKLNVKHTCLISAKTGYGIEELITKLQNIWGYQGDVYLVGCTNVGKSSLFNILIDSDYCKVQASSLVQKATTCVWPGTTLKFLKFPILRPSDIRLYQRAKRLINERTQRQAEQQLRKDQMKSTGGIKYATLMGHIGRTYIEREEKLDDFSMTAGTQSIFALDENSKEYKNSKWCYDTPGVMHNEQILSLLTIEELMAILPKHMIIPRTFILKKNMSLFVGGLGRLDFASGTSSYIRATLYASKTVPIVITEVDKAAKVYERLLGTELIGVPFGNAERLKKWPGLERSNEFTIAGTNDLQAACDVILSSAGWIGINMPESSQGKFYAWTPEKRGIFIRQPSLIPYGANLRGKRIRNSLAYHLGKPFIKQ